MKIITKKDIEKSIGGLFLMIINTTIWTFIAEYYLENKDLRIGGIILGIIIITFICYYLKFINFQKKLSSDSSEKSVEEKREDKWFMIIFGLEGIAIPIAKIILDNTNRSEFFIPFFALIVGLHFFPLAKIFNRKFDYYIGIWTCIVSFSGLLLINQKITSLNIGNAIVSLGCAISTVSYGIKMILDGKRILKV